jgi:hypothetical protein
MQLKFFVFILCLGSFIISNAQFQKGDRMVGASIGAISYNSGKTDYSYPPPTTGFTRNSSSYGISLTPNYGWFISSSTVIGGIFNLGYTHSEYFDEDEANGNTFNKDESNNFNIGAGAFVRNYFSSSGKFYPFAQVGFNLGVSSADSRGYFFKGVDKYSYDGKSSGGFFANAGVALGFTKLLSRHTGLDFSIGYNFSHSNTTFKTTTQIDLTNNGTVDQTNVSEPTQKFTNHGVALSVGFQVFLEGKK